MSATQQLIDEIKAGGGIKATPFARQIGMASACVVHRWILKGVTGATGERVKLEAIRCDPSWVTTMGAYARFLAKLPATKAESAPEVAEVPRATVERPVFRREATRAAETRKGLEAFGIY